MDIELGRTTRALRNFLEDDLSPAYLGLTDGARLHLDRFRSFLNSFYVDKFGYWPPPKDTMFSKALYRSLYFDFKSLYDHLVDSESTLDFASQRLASGGICVLQNVASFDKRHKFMPLLHPLPLLPDEAASRRRTDSRKPLRYWGLPSKQDKYERCQSGRVALNIATNGHDTLRSNSSIIQNYMRFESRCVLFHQEEKVSMVDARKVRWLLIYGTLQYLISALRAPTQVRDTEGPNYHLCCLVAESSQWQGGMNGTPSSGTCSIHKAVTSEPDGAHPDFNSPLTGHTTIEPDCQNHDYLFHTNTDPGSRRVSVDIPAPLKVSQSSRASSVRSRRRLSLTSPGSNKNSIQLKSQPHCEILVHGYGNGLNNPSQASSRTSPTKAGNTQCIPQPTLPMGAESETSWLRPATPDSTTSHARPGPLPELNLDCAIIPEPLLGSIQLEIVTNSFTASQTLSNSPESTSSQDSSLWSDGASSTSSNSSTYEGRSKPEIIPDNESGLLGGLVSIASCTQTSAKRIPHSSQLALPKIPPRRSSFRFSLDKWPSKTNL